MSSSSPPHPQYSLGKPLILRNCFLLKPETPPKYPAYGNLKEKGSSQLQTVHTSYSSVNPYIGMLDKRMLYYFQGIVTKTTIRKKISWTLFRLSECSSQCQTWWYCQGLNNKPFPKQLWVSHFYLEKTNIGWWGGTANSIAASQLQGSGSSVLQSSGELGNTS